MAARFVISGWDTLEDTQRSNIKAMLKSVIGVNSEVDLDIRNESGDADDVRKISYAPTILAAISQEYLNCLTVVALDLSVRHCMEHVRCLVVITPH